MFIQKTLGRSAFFGGVRSLNPAMQRVPNMGFNSAAAVAVKPRESIRAREDRKRELTKLMESWVCKVGFEFHVQLKSKHKMFSSKSLNSPS